jgi:hypothetical protein
MRSSRSRGWVTPHHIAQGLITTTDSHLRRLILTSVMLLRVMCCGCCLAERSGMADQHALQRKKRLEEEVVEAQKREQVSTTQ